MGKSHFTPVPLGTTLTVPQDSGLAFSSRGALGFSLEEKVDIHVKMNQGGRLTEVPPYDWRLLSRNILGQSVNDVIASMKVPP